MSGSNPLLAPGLDPSDLKQPTKPDAGYYKPRPELSGATGGMNTGMGDRLAVDRAKADVAQEAAQVPKITPPPKQEANSDPYQAFGQPAMWIAVLGSLFTRQPFVNAIKAGGAVLQATQQLDAAAAKQHFETWKIETENGLKMAQFQQKQYEDALRRIDVDAKSGKAELETNIAAYKDAVLKQAYDHGGLDEVKKLLYARKGQTAAVSGGVAGFTQHVQPNIKIADDLSSGDPNRMADGLIAWSDKNMAAQAGKGSTASGRQLAEGQDIRIHVLANKLRSGDPTQVQEAVEDANGLVGQGVLKAPSAAFGKWTPGTDPTTGKQFVSRIGASGVPEYRDLEGNPIEAPKGVAHIGSASPPTIKREDAHKLAQAAVAGNYQVLTGLARNSANIGMVDEEIGSILRASGASGAELAEASLKFHAAMREQSTIANVGARIDIGAQELKQTIPQAREASKAAVRWGAVPVDKLVQALKGASNDPDLADFALANNAVANSFAQIAARGGASTEGAREHAYSLLSIARSDEVYERQLDRLEKEAQAALAGTHEAKEQSQKAFKESVLPDKTATPAAPTPGEVRKGYRYVGGPPGERSSWEMVRP